MVPNRFSVVGRDRCGAETDLNNRLLCNSMPPLKSTAVNKSRVDVLICVFPLYWRGEGICWPVSML